MINSENYFAFHKILTASLSLWECAIYLAELSFSKPRSRVIDLRTVKVLSVYRMWHRRNSYKNFHLPKTPTWDTRINTQARSYEPVLINGSCRIGSHPKYQSNSGSSKYVYDMGIALLQLTTTKTNNQLC